MATEPLTLVAVVFEAEIPLLELQARSVAKFLSPDDVARVVVIDNSRKGLSPTTQRRLLHAYGPHSRVVDFLRPTDITPVPLAGGWYVQQLLKLAISAKVGTRYYVALDAKDHFVRPATAADFVGDGGRARMPVYPYTSHPLRPDLERALAYVGLDAATYVPRFAATVTPFTFETEAVRAMIDDIAGRRAVPDFAVEFIENKLLEFFLYSAWLVKQRGSLDAAFDVQDHSNPKVWKSTATLAGVQAAITQSDARQTPVFSVHRRALAVLPLKAARALARFWMQRGLFPGGAAVAVFLAKFRITYVAREGYRKLAGRFRAR